MMPKFGSNIPKYMIKRIFPQDGLKLDGDTLKLEVKNILMPIHTRAFPGNAKEFLEVAIDDDVVSTKGDSAFMDQVKVEYKGEVHPFNQLNKVDEIAVGESVVFLMPNVREFKKGETHKLAITILRNPDVQKKKKKPEKEKPPMKFEVEREVM